MAEVLTGVNGDVIRWARKLYNMTPEDAATSIGVDLPQYLQWESGAEYPTYAKLKEISRVLLATRILSAVFHIDSMRKTSEEFNCETFQCPLSSSLLYSAVSSPRALARLASSHKLPCIQPSPSIKYWC